MTDRSSRDSALLVPANFIRAVRDSGYSSLASAIGELVDNAIQASATDVAITVERATEEALPEITVEDNGLGMSIDDLELCLRFGGSTRFADRTHFGRFGMGLPAASLSQCRRVEVAAWHGWGSEHSVYLDVDEVAGGAVPALAAVTGINAASKSGCRIRWVRCDRIEYQRLGWLERALRRDLGRVFRRFLSAGVQLTVNGTQVEPDDWLLTGTRMLGATASTPFEPISYPFEVDGHHSEVIARFSMLPVDRWHRLDNPLKRKLGVVGGGGVSVLRAGREVARGWHLMGDKRKENYDDWWRCELEFDPILDDYFGITINKQGIRPTALLRDVVEPQLESAARLLNSQVRQAFEDVKFRSDAATSCQIAQKADLDLPPLACSLGTVPLAYSIASEVLGHDTMFEWTTAAGELNLILNVDHAAFRALYQPLRCLDNASASELRTSIELLLLAFARGAVQMRRPSTAAEFVNAWSKTYERMLRRL